MCLINKITYSKQWLFLRLSITVKFQIYRLISHEQGNADKFTHHQFEIGWTFIFVIDLYLFIDSLRNFSASEIAHAQNRNVFNKIKK